MMERFRDLGEHLFKSQCLYEDEKDRRSFKLLLSKSRKGYNKLSKGGKLLKDFYEINEKLIVELKKRKLALKNKKCSKKVVMDLLPFIHKVNPDILKDGGAYQLYMMRIYLNGFLNDSSQYEEMLMERFIQTKLERKEKKKVKQILLKQIKLLIEIMLLLLDEFEKMRSHSMI